MIPYLRSAARAGCVLTLLACASEKSPTAPVTDSVEAVSPDMIASSTMEPAPEDFANMPPEFAAEPSIISVRTDVGFNDEDGAWAQGIMEYMATNASQDVTLVLRFADREVAKKVAQGANDNFLPAFRTLRTMVSIPLSAKCGHTADGSTAHTAWHKFLVSGWKFLAWGEQKEPSGGVDEQTPCPTPPTREGGGDDPYEGGCELCQQWFYYIDGRMVAEWWECSEVDMSFCGVGDTR